MVKLTSSHQRASLAVNEGDPIKHIYFVFGFPLAIRRCNFIKVITLSQALICTIDADRLLFSCPEYDVSDFLSGKEL